LAQALSTNVISPFLKDQIATMGSLDDVFWSRVGHGHKDIDCKNFILLCKESNLVDETFKDSDAELVFLRSMPLSRRRLDLPRLKEALRRVADLKGEQEQVVHRKLIEAHARNCKPYLRRSGSLPAVVTRSTESPKNDGHERRRSSSGTKRSKHRKKEDKGDKDKTLQLPSPSSDPENRGQSVMLFPSSPANATHLPFSPSGHSQVPSTPATDVPLGEAADSHAAGLHDLSSPSHSAVALPTPSSEMSLHSLPNTPSCQYLSCPATPANNEAQEPATTQSSMLLPSCSPSLVMPHAALHSAAASVASAPVPAPVEAADTALSIQAAHFSSEGHPATQEAVEELAPESTELASSTCGAQPTPDPAAAVATSSQKAPAVPRLHLGLCTEDSDLNSLLSVRQLSASSTAAAKTLKRPVRKPMTRVVSLPAPIDTCSDVAQIVADSGLGQLPSSPQRSPGRAAIFARSPTACSSAGRLDDFAADKCKGSVEETFKAFCGEHGDMDSKSFVRVCKRCCLLDHKFTAHDARLVYSSAVPISHVRMDLQSFEVALNHVATKRGLDTGLVNRMVSWYEQPGGAESAPATPSHEHAPMGLPESPLGKALQRPASASRSRAALESCDRQSPSVMSRQSSLPNVARRPDCAAQGYLAADCAPSSGRGRSTLDGAGSLDNLAPLTHPVTEEQPSKVDDLVHRGSKDCISPHTAPLLPLQATLPIQAQVMMPHMMVGAF